MKVYTTFLEYALNLSEHHTHMITLVALSARRKGHFKCIPFCTPYILKHVIILSIQNQGNKVFKN